MREANSLSSSAAAADIALSKTMAHALRHNPAFYNLTLDNHGWTDVASLLAGLCSKGHPNLQLADIHRVLQVQRKRRYELDESGTRIRATHGHSLALANAVPPICYEAIEPPELLYHGTSPDAIEAIQQSGKLKSMRRQYVHLSLDCQSAVEIGRRKAKQPVIIEVKAKKAFTENINFYKPAEETTVWLADAIPTTFLSVLDRNNCSQCL